MLLFVREKERGSFVGMKREGGAHQIVVQEEISRNPITRRPK